MRLKFSIALATAVAAVEAYQPTFHAARPMGIPSRTSGFCRCSGCAPNPFLRLPGPCSRMNRWTKAPPLQLEIGGKTDGVFEEEIGGRKFDRSKTHMIFGVRCIETKHEIPIPITSTTENTIVGLQPLNDLEEESSDGTICNDQYDEGSILSILLGHIFSERQQGRPDVLRFLSGEPSDHHQDHYCHHYFQDIVFELVEVGADPIVSLAAAKMLSGSRLLSGNDVIRIDTKVVVRHPDAQRLRVLEHAHSYFNKRTRQRNSCSFRTEPLKKDEPLVGSSSPTPQARSATGGNRVVVFTSPALVSSHLSEAITGMAADHDAPGYRVLVPSAIISPEQLEQYNYRVVAGVEENENSDVLLEFLSSR